MTMYKPLFHRDCSLVQANGRYMIFTKLGNCIDKGICEGYIDQKKAEELINKAMES